MSGAGDRRRACALLAGGDRPMFAAPRQIRAAQAILVGLDGKRVAIVSIVIDDRPPAVVMFDGDPFLIDVGLSALSSPDLTYFEARPFRADAVLWRPAA